MATRRRTTEELQHRKPSDAERIALTLIEKHVEDGVPSFASGWLKSVLSDPSFAEYASLDADVKGYRTYLEERDESNFPEEWDQAVYVERQVDNVESVIALAAGVVSHRLYGEPDTDRTVSLGFGLAVTTSLAADVVSYTRRMIQNASRR